jgi:hypothetical protein
MTQTNDVEVPGKDILISTIENVLRGKSYMSDLIVAVETKEQELKSSRQNFNATVSRETTKVQEYCREVIQYVDSIFEEFFSILMSLREYGNSFDKETLNLDLRKLIDISNKLNFAFLQFRNDALVARGPTGHSGINLLINTIQRIYNGEDLLELLNQEILMEHSLAEVAIESIKQLEPDYFSEKFKGFYENYIDIIENFDLYFDSEDINILKQQEKDLLEEGENYNWIDVNFLSKNLPNIPTSLPAVNLVLTTGKKYIEGKCDINIFQYFLDELWKLVNLTQNQFEEVMQKTEDDKDSIDENTLEESEIIEETIDLITEALEGLDSFAETGDHALFFDNQEKLIEASEVFTESLENLKKLSEYCELIPCFMCGTKNQLGQTTCFNCKTQLPKTKEDAQNLITPISEPGYAQGDIGSQVTEKVHQLFSRAEALVEGEYPVEAFEKILDDMDIRLRMAYKAVKKPPLPDPETIKDLGEAKANKMYKIIKDASALFKQGLDTFSNGMEFLRELCNSPAIGTLEESKETILRAVDYLQRCQKLIDPILDKTF